METIEITTTKREQLIAITHYLAALLKQKGWKNGALLIFSPHTTAGLTINENADPDVVDLCLPALLVDSLRVEQTPYPAPPLPPKKYAPVPPGQW